MTIQLNEIIEIPHIDVYRVIYFDNKEHYEDITRLSNEWGIYDNYESARMGVMACNIARDIKDSTDIRRAVLMHNGKPLNKYNK